jgi:tocopherol O-methyltransferase
MAEGHKNHPGSSTSATPEQVAAYYAALTDRYLNYSGSTLAWHFGLWDESVSTVEQALLRSNEILVEGCGVGPGCQVLDTGCGVGGLAIYLAERYGARVTGVTVCEPHVDLAGRLASERGVGSLVSFRNRNFEALDFEDASFDLVVAQEAFCHAQDRVAYLRGVRRVLRPGGRWRAVDGFLGDTPLDEAAEQFHRDAQAGWKIPPLARWRDVGDLLGEVGFVDVLARDLSELALPGARALADQGLVHLLRLRAGMAPDPVFDDHMRACAGFSGGLLGGVFTYHLLGGTV